MTIGYKHALEARSIQETMQISAKDAAELLKVKYSLPQKPQSIERRIREVLQRLTPPLVQIPDVSPKVPTELVMEFKPSMIGADVHAPYFNRDAFTDFLVMAKERGIKRGIFPGDFVDNDWCSHFMDEAKVSGQENVSDIIHSIYRTLYAMCDTFDEVIILRGNHDERLAKKLDKNLSMSEMYKIFATPPKGSKLPNLYERLTIAERFQMYMTGSPTGDWLIAHQLNYSSIRTKVAQDIATRYEVNTVTSHVHDLGITTSRNKSRFFAVAPGCLADEEKMSYKVMRVNTHSPWIMGWALLNKSGIPEVFHYNKSYGIK